VESSVVTTTIDSRMVDDAPREAGSVRPPASTSAPGPRRRIGGSVLLVALGAFALTRFVVAEPATTTEAPPVGVEVAAVTANDVAALVAAVEQRPNDLRAIQALGVALVGAWSTHP
jgi:hypothetical protein